MPIGRRLSTLLVVLALVGAPAVVLRVFCVGHSCDGATAGAQAAVPFCSLRHELRRAVAAGFREGRSPDVMASTAPGEAVRTRVGSGLRVPWPWEPEDVTTSDLRVPIAFLGGSIRSTPLPGGTRLDAIAPTLERITGMRREHPEVRTGDAAPGVTVEGEPVPMIVVIAWKGIGTADLEAEPDAWPHLRRAVRDGAGTLDGSAGSLPLDPTATLTTIGTGALPSAHGVTGTRIRDDRGRVRSAWTVPGTGSVIATFADDVDHDAGGRPIVGAVLSGGADRGLIGDGWYLDGVDRDHVVTVDRDPRAAARAVERLVSSDGFGNDADPDVLGVVLTGSVGEVDAATADVVSAVRSVVPGATFVIAGTGSLRGPGGLDATTVAGDVDETLGAPVVEATSADGLFLDRGVLVERSLTSQRVADAMRAIDGPQGEDLFADVYPSFAVAFSRYC